MGKTAPARPPAGKTKKFRPAPVTQPDFVIEVDIDALYNYRWMGDRTPEAKKAWAAYSRVRRLRRSNGNTKPGPRYVSEAPFPHGTLRGYKRGCPEKLVAGKPCVACRRAGADARASWRAIKREAVGLPPATRGVTNDDQWIRDRIKRAKAPRRNTDAA